MLKPVWIFSGAWKGNNVKNVMIFLRCNKSPIYNSAKGSTCKNFFSSSSKDTLDSNLSGKEKHKFHEREVKPGDKSENNYIQEGDVQNPRDFQLPLRRRSRKFMAPGSRLVGILPQQYWQVVGASQEEMQKAVGEVQQTFGDISMHEDQVNIDKQAAENILERDKSKAIINQEENGHMSVPPSRSVWSGEESEKCSPIAPKLRRPRILDVSSRLSQLMDITADFGEKHEKTEVTSDDGEKYKKQD